MDVSTGNRSHSTLADSLLDSLPVKTNHNNNNNNKVAKSIKPIRQRKASIPIVSRVSPDHQQFRRCSSHVPPACTPSPQQQQPAPLQLSASIHRWSRRLSRTWLPELLAPSSTATAEDSEQLKLVASSGRQLCSQYLHVRLRRELQQHRGAISRGHHQLQLLKRLGSRQRLLLVDDNQLCCVFRQLWLVAELLIRQRAQLYGPRAYRAGVARYGDKSVGGVITALAGCLFQNASEITWARVVSLFAMAGGLALECIQTGHIERVHTVLDAVEDVCSGPMGEWIVSQGGWVALAWHYQPPEETPSIGRTLTIGALGLLLVALFVILMLRLITNSIGE